MELIKVLTKEERTEYTNSTGEHWALFRCPECNNILARPKSNGSKQKVCGDCRSSCTNYHKTHGMSHTPVYKQWRSMMRRAGYKLTTKSKAKKYYQDKGITVCKRWCKFKNFYYDMNESYFDSASLDRIDNKKGYKKKNCQWLTVERNRIKDKIKKIRQLDKHGTIIGEFESSHEAARVLHPNESEKRQRAIANSYARVARGERKTYLNYIWEYV